MAIVACSTPPGVSGIAVVKISGKNAIKNISTFVKDSPFNEKTPLSKVCFLVDKDGLIFDEAVVTSYVKPNSYTGENLIEISCHGNPNIVSKIIDLSIEGGSTLAEPGEFTKTAFLNGKLDLSEAESVSGIIHSKSITGAKAGIKNLRTSRKIVKILRPIIVGNKDVYIKATPAESFKVDYTISYDHILLDHQRLTLDYFDENIYRELISNSRTFGFKDDVDMLLEKGLIKGGSLNNAVLLDEKGIVNEEELRYPDEFVRHKILDFIGDIFLLGKKVEGHFEIFCGGHSLTQELLKTLMSDKLNWKLMDENPSHIDKRSIESRTEISAAI